MEPVDIRLNFFHTSGFLPRAERFVEVVNSPLFAPTICDVNDPPQTLFDADTLLTDLVYARNAAFPDRSFRDRWPVRETEPRCEGIIGLRWTQFQFSAVHPGLWAELFDWARQLAEVLQPDFGACHRMRRKGQCDLSNWSVAIRLMDFDRAGLPCIGERTYLSQRMVERIGLGRLRTSGFAFECLNELDWGVALEVQSNPWEVAVGDMCEQFPAIMQALNPAGIFGDYGAFGRNPFYGTPGPAWTRELAR